MRERWFVYNIYPNGKGNRATPEELNVAMNMVRDEFTSKGVVQPYRYFELIYRDPDRRDGDGVKVGVKRDVEPRDAIQACLNSLRTRYREYSRLDCNPGEQDAETCQLMAVATECRRCMLEGSGNSWPAERDMAQILHFMLNPCGYDGVARVHIKALADIEQKVADQDIRAAVASLRRILQVRGTMQLR